MSGPLFIGEPEILANLDLRCPDCSSETEHWTDRDGRAHIDLMHDDTCPTWRAMRNEGAR